MLSFDAGGAGDYDQGPDVLTVSLKLVFLLLVFASAGALLGVLRSERGSPRRVLTLAAGFFALAALIFWRAKTGSWVPRPQGLRVPWGAVTVTSFGLAAGATLVAGWFVTLGLAARDNLARQRAAALYLSTVVGALVGARLLFVWCHPALFVRPLDPLFIHNGGLMGFGAVAGGLLAAALVCRKVGVSFWQWADVAAPVAALATVGVQLGSFLYGAGYGTRATGFLAMTFPKGSPPWQHHVYFQGLAQDAARSFPVYPLPLFEAAAVLVLAALLFLWRGRRTFSGQLLALWLAAYGLVRLGLDSQRGDLYRAHVGPLSVSQVLAVGALVGGVLSWLILARVARRRTDGLRLWEDAAARPAPASPAGEPVPARVAPRSRL